MLFNAIGRKRTVSANENLLQEVIRRLVENLQPEQIILFGSHAWGKSVKGSDLDIMVIKVIWFFAIMKLSVLMMLRYLFDRPFHTHRNLLIG